MKMNKLLSLLLVLAMLLGASALAEGVALTDMADREVTLDAPATRLVVLQPADVEILCAIGAQDTIVGRGAYVDYPDSIVDVPAVDSGAETNIEAILALEPQAVVMSKMSQTTEQVEALEQAGVKVIVSDAQNIEGVYTAIEMLGQLVGKEAEAAALIDEMKAGFDAVAEQAAAAGITGKTVYFEISPLVYGLWTAGQNTFMDEIASICGLTNIFHDQNGWVSVSEEQVIAANPDLIVTTTDYPVNDMDGVTEICSRTGWETVSAVQNGLVVLGNNNAMTRPGPRLVEAAQFLLELALGEDAPAVEEAPAA